MPDVKFRWAVGEPDGPQSPPWTLTVRGSEFVLAVRTPRQRWHVTFHASGWRHWRFASPAMLRRAGGPSSGSDAGHLASTRPRRRRRDRVHGDHADQRTAAGPIAPADGEGHVDQPRAGR